MRGPIPIQNLKASSRSLPPPFKPLAFSSSTTYNIRTSHIENWRNALPREMSTQKTVSFRKVWRSQVIRSSMKSNNCRRGAVMTAPVSMISQPTSNSAPEPQWATLNFHGPINGAIHLCINRSALIMRWGSQCMMRNIRRSTNISKLQILKQTNNDKKIPPAYTNTSKICHSSQNIPTHKLAQPRNNQKSVTFHHKLLSKSSWTQKATMTPIKELQRSLTHTILTPILYHSNTCSEKPTNHTM